MIKNIPKKYWDSGLFICFLNDDEDERRKICEDNFQHAKDGNLLIFTSYWTEVEVIRPRKKSLPFSEKLTPLQISRIQKMFEWEWIKKIQVDERVIKKAIELSRDYGIHPTDAIHAASAILSIPHGVDAIQRWDRDFSKIVDLIKVEEPTFITKQLSLISKPLVGPHPKDFEP